MYKDKRELHFHKIWKKKKVFGYRVGKEEEKRRDYQKLLIQVIGYLITPASYAKKIKIKGWKSINGGTNIGPV